MEAPPKNNQVVDLLTKLKKSEAVYPTEIFTVRRQKYLKQIANISPGIGVHRGIKNAAKDGSRSIAVSTIVTGKVLETILTAALILEAGTIAYLYREKIADLVKSYITPNKVQEVTPASAPSSPQNSEGVEVTKTQLAIVTTVVLPSNTPLSLPSGTPSPETVGDSNKNNVTNPNANSTPNPNGNNGNHYGQTPKPERTKDNNNNGNGNNGGGNNNDNGNGNGNGNNDDGGNNNGNGNKKP